MVRRTPVIACVVLTFAVLLPACGGGGSDSPTLILDDQEKQFVDGVTHPYFPIEPGMHRIYDGLDEGQARHEEVRALDDRRTILGIPCTAMFEEVFLEGQLTEITTEWYAQDSDGGVWKFGEESYERVGNTFVLDTDSWVAGEGAAEPWLAFSAFPQVGEVYSGYRPDGVDALHVTSITATANVPAGDFTDCLEVTENPDDPEDTDIILYARGIGRVREENQGGITELVEVRTN